MKLTILGLVLLAVSVPRIIGQENTSASQKETLHLWGGTERANVSLVADSMERQDPPTPSASPYASVVRLKGNVVIRTCCIQRSPSRNRPKQVMVMQADEADYHQENGEIEARGVVRVKFLNYPK